MKSYNNSNLQKNLNLHLPDKSFGNPLFDPTKAYRVAFDLWQTQWAAVMIVRSVRIEPEQCPK